MNKEQLAATLNGREYRNEITIEEVKQAKDAGLIVFYGASDDLMEISGLIQEEIGAYDGGKAVIFKYNGTIDVANGDEYEMAEMTDHRKAVAILDSIESGNIVEALWCPKDDGGHIIASWVMKTSLPHAVFFIKEDDEVYCQGIVVDSKDLIGYIDEERSRRPTSIPWPNSSNVSLTEYDITTGALKVSFKNGSIYSYYDVPPDVWKQLSTCESIGSFIAKNIVKKYKSVKL